MNILSLIQFNPYAIVSLLLIATAAAIAMTAINTLSGKPKAIKVRQTKNTTDEGDYDFLSTPESIPSQYDIALAFLATGQFDRAANILRKVIESNHPIYSSKAHEKIAQLQASTN